MHFDKGHLYHVYNRSLSRRQLFVTEANYLFFLQKVRSYFLDYSSIVAYCLMPTHFHLMIYVKTTEVEIQKVNKPSKTRTLNFSIGIMLRSYTNAMQKQEGFKGSLFQQHTKAPCLTESTGITPAYFNTAFGTKMNVSIPESSYPQFCFDYIHQNPVKAGYVPKNEQWIYSSARDYAGLRNGTLVDRAVAEEFGLVYR